MTVSNALPIQFWPSDQDTYNESEICGIEAFCYCQPLQLDDQLRLYIDDDDPESKVLAFIDSDGGYAYTDAFDANGFVSFLISDQLSAGKYQAVIYDLDNPAVIMMKEPSEWQDEIGTWVKDDGDNTLTNGPTSAQQLVRLPLVIPDGVTFSFSYFVTITGTWTGTLQVTPYISDAANLSKDNVSDNTLTFNANVTNELHTATFTVRSGDGASTDPMAYLKFVRFGPNGGSGTATLEITVLPTELLYIGDAAILYKSDCLDIRETHECTELITYSNNKNFAGLVYEGITPLPEFSLRVPAVFFHESFPQEEEVHPKSDDTWIRLSSRMERKKLFDIGYVTYYFHQKIQLVLMHDNIEIQGEQWKKRDAYNIEEAQKRYPKPKANVLLTDKNFIIRNLI